VRVAEEKLNPPGIGIRSPERVFQNNASAEGRRAKKRSGKRLGQSLKLKDNEKRTQCIQFLQRGEGWKDTDFLHEKKPTQKNKPTSEER